MHDPVECLSQVNEVISKLIPSSVSIRSFSSRWQSIGGKLLGMKSLLSQVCEYPEWAENPVVSNLVEKVLWSVCRVETLMVECSDSSHVPGKLLMQSDLDMASGWISKQNEDIELILRSGVLSQSTAIVLSHPSPEASPQHLHLFLRDLFTRLQIGSDEFRTNALDHLLLLLMDHPKAATLVGEGDLGCLITLLDSDNLYLREQALTILSILASCNSNCLPLPPFLRIIQTASMPLKETAAKAVHAITSHSYNNSSPLSAYSALPVLIQLCKSGSPVAQSYAAGAIKNLSTLEDIRFSLAQQGALPVLLQLLLSGNASAQEYSASCIAILASSGHCFRDLVLEDKGLEILLYCLAQSSSSATLEHVLRAIYSLSSSHSAFTVLSSSTTFIVQIAELLKHGNVMLQHISASLLQKLSIGGRNKRAISGCMGSLVKLMESAKPDGLQEIAANALVSLLTVKANRKDLVQDEKSMTSLVQMLDPGNDYVSKKFPVAVMAAIMAGGSQGCRKRLLEAGAHGHLQRLSEMEVSGAKKAMQKLSLNRIKKIFTMTWS